MSVKQNTTRRVFPITNVYAKGGYTLEVKLGSNQQPANLILDTGSSTLVVQREDYDPFTDQALSPTSLAQNVVYGMGGWYGPVITTDVSLGDGQHHIRLQEVHLAFTKKESETSFAQADGMLGLGFMELNIAHDLHDYLASNQVDPRVTFPWFVTDQQKDDDVQQFRTFLHEYPKQPLTPYFTQLTASGMVANQFGFYIHRASIYHTHDNANATELAEHPLNQGLFVMGDAVNHAHVFTGQPRALKVVDDKYYNVQLKSMQVGECPAVEAPELGTHFDHYGSNAIIDSGASMVVLPDTLFETLIDDLAKHHPDFAQLLAPFAQFTGQEKGIPIDLVDVELWPDIHFVFDDIDGQPITLTMSPTSFWQAHAPARDQIAFQFIKLAHWPNQAIFGLPFMCNYFTIFDRDQGKHGAVLLADKVCAVHAVPRAHQEDVALLCQLLHKHGLAAS
ncbi:A1 family peptidase [Aestuariibacter halophilus]|uniref:A1 family peptidase n=1 Tax=Fluctibacter halophilus TaxID=226011 RepID=A0ABS8G5W5_9ALTE|nr:pepsin-like aspartic protease [Aestuariibacter halophilus]MCC2615798.1 A1 family peptidase [Aestuariibacter halophilus]